eukprot:scaffold7715_cov91-Skeletonema_dohrnii-CCMP3373.AAC.1
MTSPSTSVSSASDDEMKGRVVSYLNDYDVLNGRGKDINNLAGNINFQRLIARNKDHRYKECKESEKKNISKRTAVLVSGENGDAPHHVDDIVDAVRRNGGRFLKHDKSNKIYVDIGNKGAREKTSQAFRVALRKEKKESVPPVGNHPGFFLSNQSGRTTSADLSFSLGPNFVGDALAGVPVRKTSSEFCLDMMKEDDSNVQIISRATKSAKN